MIDAAIIGLGRWGRSLVDAVHKKSALIRFVCAADPSPDTRGYAEAHGEFGKALGADHAA